MNPSVFIHCASEFSVSCAGLLETESIWGERQASLGNLHSCRVRDGSKMSKQHYRDVLLKEPLSSAHLISPTPTHVLEKGRESLGINVILLSDQTIIRSLVIQQKNAVLVGLYFSFFWLILLFPCLFFVCLPISLPPGWVFVLPQREHVGLSLPMPTVSQLPALSRLLLEGACRWFP